MGFKRRTDTDLAIAVLQTSTGQRLLAARSQALRKQLSDLEAQWAGLQAELRGVDALRDVYPAARGSSLAGGPGLPRMTDLHNQLTAYVHELQRRHGLSERQREIVELAIKGYYNADIAERLSISINTVKSHVLKIVTQCGVRRLRDLARHFWGEG